MKPAMKPLAHSYLGEIINYVPGKSKVGNKKAIKLSSNENALKTSPKAIQAYKNHVPAIFRYADGGCTALREALAKQNNIDAKKIVCGAGSDELIAILAYAFAGVGDEIIYSEYGFLMYPISTKRVGAIPVKVKEKNLKTDVEAILQAITPKTKIIFLANPNNPTGSYLNKADLEDLINKIPKNILIALDHAYEEFVEAKDYPSGIELVNQHENVVMLRTFSKIYGLASLRIGWCYSSSNISEILNKVRGPFNVGGPAQAAAVAALEDEEFFQLSKDHNSKWRKIFFDELKGNKKIIAYPSQGNFILLDFGSKENSVKANKALLAEGIIIREMDGYGLPHCLRLTIGTAEENMQLLNILQNGF